MKLNTTCDVASVDSEDLVADPDPAALVSRALRDWQVVSRSAPQTPASLRSDHSIRLSLKLPTVFTRTAFEELVVSRSRPMPH